MAYIFNDKTTNGKWVVRYTPADGAEMMEKTCDTHEEAQSYANIETAWQIKKYETNP